MTESSMTKGPGELAARARTRRLIAIIGGLAGAGFVVGFVAALVERDDAPLFAGGTMPPAFAIVAAVIVLIVVGWGSWRFHRDIDEYERRDNLIAGTVGINLLLGGYPIWLILWKGGVVPEPNHFILFGAVFAATLITYLWRKLR